MRRIVFILIVILLSSSVYAEPTQEAASLQEAFVKVSKEVGPAVVSISAEHIERYMTRQRPFFRFEDDFFNDFFDDFFMPGPEREFKRTGLGSGVIIDKEGHILTNEHVISGADKITVTLPDGREFEGHVTGSDIYSDLAVVKIESKGNLPFARLGDSDSVRIGHWAIAIGNPFAFAVKNPEPTVTVGVVSALRRSLPRTDRRAREYTDLIQTDAAINPGNSGGPLLNIYGDIIGINVAIFTLSGGSEGVGFAVPVNTARKIMEDLKHGKKVLYGWLGVMIQDINAELAAYFNLEESYGVLVSRILEKSPAEKAGLEPGDIIVSLDDEKVKTTQDVIRMVLKKDVGSKVILGVIRNGKIYSMRVEIGERPEDETVIAQEKTDKAIEEDADTKSWRGLEVSEIMPEAVRRFNLEAETGVLIVAVEAESAAETAGIRAGDVIYEINRMPVKNITDYRKAIKKVKGDALVGTYRGYVVVKEK
ncbi:MAG: Do family serine endopeptidase [Candidatus Omnitrophica bacterium]|nr:Do family serine endopeptidase [Candidatus Omnitrophota bacterium]